MLKEISLKIARFLAPDYFQEVEKNFESRVNQKVAAIIAKMDPFEPLMLKFNGIFSREYDHPESKLDAKGQIQMKLWGYQQAHDPCFEHMMNWMMDTQGNATLKRGNPTPETILYGRSQISNIVLILREIGRLSLLYEEMLEENKIQDFDNTKSVE